MNDPYETEERLAIMAADGIFPEAPKPICEAVQRLNNLRLKQISDKTDRHE